MNTAPVLMGLLLPEAILHTHWFSVLAAFVALNTVIYVCLSLFKMFPAPRWSRRGGRNRRSETRSIYPDDPI